MPGIVNPNFNLNGSGTETFTGSKTGIAIDGLGQIDSVVPVVQGSAAPTAIKVTVVIAADKKTFSLYAWKATAAGNTALIAETSPVTVNYVAFGVQ